ncbi:hypothetical protein B0H13DRAFT_2244639 [Mycena leptocephala]|nr:hypothetical protein B0H13DRAFT_2244639 [Mycena leptocephala]
MPRGNKCLLASQDRIPCPWPGSPEWLKSFGGVTYHVNAIHRPSNIVSESTPPVPSPPLSPQQSNHNSDDEPHPISPTVSEEPLRPQKNYHPFLNDGAPPQPRNTAAADDWMPFDDKVQFEVADFLFRKVQMSSKNIDQLLEMWALSMKHEDLGPFQDYKEIYETIDATTVGNTPWKCLQTEPLDPSPDTPAWARERYDVWYRDPDVVITNMLDNPDLDGAFDTTPYVRVDAHGKRRWSDFMSANFAWRHCGAMYTLIFFGNNKTTVSVATGNVEYRPGYISIGNPHNNMRQAHRDTVMPFIFLAIPKSDRKYDNDPEFRKFKRKLYHASLAAVLSSLKPGMKKPVVRRCPDGHIRRAIYDFGPFIADYPEQVLLAGIVQNWCAKRTALSTDLDGHIYGRRTHELTDELLTSFSASTLWDSYGIDVVIPFTRDFPCADIHEMISSDLLHQVIKGSFKDCLVTWVGEYLYLEHPKAGADAIMDDINRRIAATPAFPCLRRFKQGRRFKQWTGDDSKALLKVYLPAIKGLVPDQIVQAITSFLDFCYLIFRTLDVRTDTPGGSAAFSLPQQHSLVHYHHGVEEYGAPGEVCSSITESCHITAVKKPWRRSSRYEALSQMLLTNKRLDKLAAACADFVERGMLPPTYTPPLVDPEDDDGGPVDTVRVQGNVVLARARERRYLQFASDLAKHINVPAFPILLAHFFLDQLHSKSYSDAGVDINPSDISSTPLSVFHSAIATFHAPSDLCGVRGMRRERIRLTPSWRKHGARRDCAFAVEDQDKPGFRGMSVVRIKLFFSFTHDGVDYPCALVEWFKKVGRSTDSCAGMWVVEPELHGKHWLVTILHLDSLLRGAHLSPVFGSAHIPVNFLLLISQHSFLAAFNAFYVNRYIDHHANEIAF